MEYPDDLMEKYEKFADLLLEDKYYLDPSATFLKACSLIGADPAELGSLLEKEMGMGGDELMEAYRKHEDAYLLRKYKAPEG